MTTADVIYEIAKELPDDKAQQLLGLAQALKQEQPRESQLGNHTQPSLLRFAGVLKNSPAFAGDPVEIHRALRDEWS